ncbi:unnamed protein product, partial [Brachionus calyciflorus]
MKILNEINKSTQYINNNNNLNIEIDYSESNSLCDDDPDEEEEDKKEEKNTVNLTNSDFQCLTERLKASSNYKSCTNINAINIMNLNERPFNSNPLPPLSSSPHPPPSVQKAKIDLLKHLKLYLELCKIYETKKMTNNNNNNNCKNECIKSPTSSSSTTSNSFLSSYSFDNNNNTNTKKKKNIKTFINKKTNSVGLDNNKSSRNFDDYDDSCNNFLIGDEVDLYLDENENINNRSLNNRNMFRKLKPLIPSWVFSDNEKFVGRDWLIKEIDK